MLLSDVTVVVPTKNEARNIPTFLRSLPSQLSLVVVDSSNDATPEVIQTLRPQRTRIIRLPGNVAEARQAGAEAATTQWLLFSDADVAFAPGYFSRLERQRGGDAFYGPKVGGEASAYPAYYRCFVAWQRVMSCLGIPAASGSNMLVRRAALAQVGGFDLRLTVNEDSELLWRLRRHAYRVRFAPDLVVLDCDQRRLQRGVVRKVLHSFVRCTLLYLNLMPDAWRRSDWGYWAGSHADGPRSLTGGGGIRW